MEEDEAPNIAGGVPNYVKDVQKAVGNLRKEVADKSTELLERIKGKVFHAVTANNRVLQYRVGLDGKITLEKTIKSFNNQARKIRAARETLIRRGKDVPIKAQRQFRAVVTGDPNKRIRDHMKETPQVKMLDKISFTLGVLTICLSEWIVLRHPQWFPLYYFYVMGFLFITRYITYKQDKYQYFMLDFCYFANLSCMCQACFFPSNLLWFKINFALSMGPIMSAIVVWQNSLVFHSMDKVTSFFLHAFASMYCHLYRWNLINPNATSPEDSLNFFTGFVYPMLAYLAWQITYIFITECTFVKTRLDKDPDLMTSLRYLSNDKKNGLNQFVNSFCRKYGIIEKEDELRPEMTKTKVIFAVTQFLYNVFTIWHVAFLYRFYFLSCVYIVFMFMWGTWNGASYYIEVFSKRYNLKFVHKPSGSGEKTTGTMVDAESTEEDDEDENEFVEALESIDLTEPLTAQLYDEIFKDIVSEPADFSDEILSKKQHNDSFSCKENYRIVEVSQNNPLKINIFTVAISDKNNLKEDKTEMTFEELRAKRPQLIIDYLLAIEEKKSYSLVIPELIADATKDEKDGSSSEVSVASRSSESDKWEVLSEKKTSE